jgi:hypothetical protein
MRGFTAVHEAKHRCHPVLEPLVLGSHLNGWHILELVAHLPWRWLSGECRAKARTT